MVEPTGTPASEDQPAPRGGARRFGIGEWYGRSFVELSREERRQLATFQLPPSRGKPPPACPFTSSACNKTGGVCSLRLYQQSQEGEAILIPSSEGELRTVCPRRFEQDNLIYQWVGERILGSLDPMVVSEVNFLQRLPEEGGTARDDVGRIDKVLVASSDHPLNWCALEVQAVYFSGDAMSREWSTVQTHSGSGTPFPTGRRRLDYRSSGPKRLMPQLQIKVPSLRRWGKKMAVVVDVGFWNALGAMDQVSHVSNCDIAWFIVRYDETGASAQISLADVRLTTLERSVEGLTAGVPVDLAAFEQRILQKMPRV